MSLPPYSEVQVSPCGIQCLVRDILDQADTSEGGFLQPVNFTTRSVPELSRFEYLSDAMSGAQRMILAPTRIYGYAVASEISSWRLENVVVQRSFSHGHLGKSPGGAGEHLVLRLYNRGRLRLWGEDFNGFMPDDGDITISRSVPSLTIFETVDLSIDVINIPLDLLGLDVSQMQMQAYLPKGTLANRLLSCSINTWITELFRLHTSDAALLEANIIDIVRSLVLRGPIAASELPMMRRARSRAIRQFIDGRITDPNLELSEVFESFPMSRASMYREFEVDGGIARYIARRRLEKALSELANAPAKRGQIGTIAQSVGYVEPSHFSKAFREHFGFSPSDALALSRAPHHGDDRLNRE